MPSKIHNTIEKQPIVFIINKQIILFLSGVVSPFSHFTMFKLPFVVFFISFSASLQAQNSYDVCVYGGTSAGVVAAYTAKMAGKSVVLIEPTKHLGGLSSGGLGQTDIGNKYAITGISRDFYRKVGQHYGRFEQWTFEPHVAENLFGQYVKKAGVQVLFSHRIIGIKKPKTYIEEITLEATERVGSAVKIKAKVFIDASYEGDLMARAGVSYTVGREANGQYNETYNGVQMLDKHQFPDGIDPYKIPNDPTSGLLWGISNEPLAARGSGDAKAQAYNFRLCLSTNPANQIPISRPAGYDSTQFELLLRYINSKKMGGINWNLMHLQPMPNQKTDINNSGPFSTDMIGMNYDYANADYQTRAKIVQKHVDYTKSLLYFLGNDLRVPEHLRAEMLTYGYPKDEYTDNGNFSPQIYVREARRMVGAYVMTQANCVGTRVATDHIGMAAYTMDSHNCQRVVVKDANGRAQVKNEGDVQIGGFPPYPVSYASLVPRPQECSNLLVPVCLSATHIAYGSIRMEPVFMVLAQAAAVAAVLAIDTKKPVQGVSAAKIRNILERNPLMDGSRPEILVDSDDSAAVARTGNWERQAAWHCYGKSLLVANGNQNAAVRFTPNIPKAGKYKIYVYHYVFKTGNAPTIQTKITNGKTVNFQTLVSPTNIENSATADWVFVGEHTLPAGKQSYVELTAGQGGVSVADAVLFVSSR